MYTFCTVALKSLTASLLKYYFFRQIKQSVSYTARMKSLAFRICIIKKKHNSYKIDKFSVPRLLRAMVVLAAGSLILWHSSTMIVLQATWLMSLMKSRAVSKEVSTTSHLPSMAILPVYDKHISFGQRNRDMVYNLKVLQYGYGSENQNLETSHLPSMAILPAHDKQILFGQRNGGTVV
jgi:hypothetical protein